MMQSNTRPTGRKVVAVGGRVNGKQIKTKAAAAVIKNTRAR